MDNNCEMTVKLNQDGVLQYECTYCGSVFLETFPIHSCDFCPKCGHEIKNQRYLLEKELNLVKFRNNILNILKG